MRDPARISRVLAKLEAHWQVNPDMRLGQLLTALVPPGRDIFYIEDDWLEDRIPEVSQSGSMDFLFEEPSPDSVSRKPPMGGNPCGEIPFGQESQPCVLPVPRPVVSPHQDSLVQKAAKAIRLARATLGEDATMQAVEDQAFNFMSLDDAILDARLAEKGA